MDVDYLNIFVLLIFDFDVKSCDSVFLFVLYDLKFVDELFDLFEVIFNEFVYILDGNVKVNVNIFVELMIVEKIIDEVLKEINIVGNLDDENFLFLLKIIEFEMMIFY